MKNVLITGAGGFIGSHLAERCVELGLNVKALVRYNSGNSWGWLEEISHKDQIETFSGDIRDFESLTAVMKDVDTIFHLAALIGIPYSYTHPLAYLKTNVEGVYNVLEAAKQNNLERIVITSTSETYGTAQYIPIDEKHPSVGQSPYSASKIAGDQLAMSYYYSFNLPVRIVRPFNTFGPRQSLRAFIPTVIGQLLAGKKKLQLGNLESSRDFTYVKDTVEGFIEIAKSDDLTGQAVNIGNSKEISMKSLVGKITGLMNIEAKIESETRRVRNSSSEVWRLVCDNSKLLSHTSWEKKYNLDRGLLETIKWMKLYAKNNKREIYNI